MSNGSLDVIEDQAGIVIDKRIGSLVHANGGNGESICLRTGLDPQLGEE